nr:MAG TPA: hypothetical protein [Caudoviricetes sp.]
MIVLDLYIMLISRTVLIYLELLKVWKQQVLRSLHCRTLK